MITREQDVQRPIADNVDTRKQDMKGVMESVVSVEQTDVVGRVAILCSAMPTNGRGSSLLNNMYCWW